jgi:hypothetical protein
VHRKSGGIDFHIAKYAAGDGTIVWERSYSGAANHRASAIAVDPADNVFVAANSASTDMNDFYVAKYAGSDGAVLWEKHYNSPENGRDFARAIALDGVGDLVLTGSSDFRFYTVKYAGSDGAVLWERRDGGPGIGILEGKVMGIDEEGNIVVSGHSFGDGSYNIYTAKYDKTDGALLWQRIFNGGVVWNDVPYTLAFTPGGKVIIGGTSGTNLFFAQYKGTDGTIEWERLVPGQTERNAAIYSLVVDTNGDVFATGEIDWVDYSARISGVDGAVLWQRTNSFSGISRKVALDAEQNVVVTGSTQTVNTERPTDIYTAKFAAADGRLIWERRYNDIASSHDFGQLIDTDSQGNVFVSGYSGTNYFIAKYAHADGRVLWQTRHENRENAIEVGSTGDMMTTGYIVTSSNGVSVVEMITARRSGENGTVRWAQRFNAGEGKRARGWAVALDTNQNVIATGTFGSGSTNDIYTAKYRGTDGYLLWERRHGTAGDDAAFAIVVDRNQDVILGGYLDRKVFAAKYSGADGALLWEQQLPSTNDWIGTSTLVLVDQRGDIFFSGGSRSESYIAKLRGLNGSLLWENRFSVSPSDGTGVSHLALDSAGNLVSGGHYADARTRMRADARFVKYGGVDGAIIWEKRLGEKDSVEQSAGLIIDEADDVLAGIVGPAFDFALLKLSGSDGALVSELKEPGLYPLNLASAPGGGIAVTGERSYDLLTVLLRDQVRARVNGSIEAGGVLRLRWPETYTGWRLEALQDPRGISPNGWTTLAGSSTTNALTIPIESGARSSFFRLVRP